MYYSKVILFSIFFGVLIFGVNFQDAEAINDDDEVLRLKSLRAQLEAGNNQLKNAVRNLEYSVSDSNNPAQLSDISRDISCFSKAL